MPKNETGQGHPLRAIDDENTSFIINKGPERFFRVPDLLNEQGLKDYFWDNYGVEIELKYDRGSTRAVNHYLADDGISMHATVVDLTPTSDEIKNLDRPEGVTQLPSTNTDSDDDSETEHEEEDVNPDDPNRNRSDDPVDPQAGVNQQKSEATDYDKMTIDELETELAIRGLPTTGKNKQERVDRLKQADKDSTA